MLSVQVHESLVHDHAQPDKRRRGGTVGVVLEALAGGQESLLQHVFWPQPAAQRLGQAKLNHPPQPLPLARKQLGQSLCVAATQAALEVCHPDAGIAGHAGLL